MKELDLILKNIKNKELSPVYFFHGEETYYIDLAVKAFEHNVLSEDEKAFNQTVIYGKDTSIREVLSLARQFPMMGDKQVIIVKEAQDLSYIEDEADALAQYIENPVPSTLLVFAHKNKKLDGKRKVTKKLSANKMLFLSEKVKDYDVHKFIQDELKRQKINASPNIPMLLAEYLGNNLSRIDNELHKLKIVLNENDILDEKIVEKHIGISKEFNIIELQKALFEKNADKALKIAHFMGKNPKSSPMPMSIGFLFNSFSKLVIYQAMVGKPQTEIMTAMEYSNPYFLKDFAVAARHYHLKHTTRIISLLREIDLKSKGLSVRQPEDEELYIELVYKILNIDKLKVKL